MTASCQNCKFWKRGMKSGTWDAVANEYPKVPAEWGDCRRYAPRGPVVVHDNFQACDAFPGVGENEWCGEHEFPLVPQKEPA